MKEFAVGAVKREEDGEYIHQWVLGLEAGELDAEKAKQLIDEHLREVNKNYAVARKKALKDLRVKVVPADRLYAFLEQTKKKGGPDQVPESGWGRSSCGSCWRFWARLPSRWTLLKRPTAYTKPSMR